MKTHTRSTWVAPPELNQGSFHGPFFLRTSEHPVIQWQQDLPTGAHSGLLFTYRAWRFCYWQFLSSVFPSCSIQQPSGLPRGSLGGTKWAPCTKAEDRSFGELQWCITVHDKDPEPDANNHISLFAKALLQGVLRVSFVVLHWTQHAFPEDIFRCNYLKSFQVPGVLSTWVSLGPRDLKYWMKRISP